MKTSFRALALCLLLGGLTTSAFAADMTYQGTLYRNGGHYGVNNSDVQLEMAQATTADAAILVANVTTAIGTVMGTALNAVQQTWNGTLYNNGGHYGLANSEEKLNAQR